MFLQQRKCIVQIGIQEPMLCLENNATFSINNLVHPLSINVGPFFPFHPLHFLFFHSFRIAPRM
jgi:hydrogenase maturation factor HypF (carbamoyltransferase family)